MSGVDVAVHSRADRWRSLAVPAVAGFIVFAILVMLGVWQLERKTWKEGLIAALASRAYGAPTEIAPEAAWPSWRAEDEEFRRVEVTGTMLHDKETRLHGLMEERRGSAVLGYYVFTPLRRPDGTIVMINRGFVTPARLDRTTRLEGQHGGNIRLTGLVRAPERRSLFLPANDPAKNEWFVRDVGDMARAHDLDRVAPFYIDADATPNPGGWPKGGQTRMELPNDHLGYAMTWFGLAASLAGVFIAFAWRRFNPRAESRESTGAGRFQYQGAQADGPGHQDRITS